jgi:hypothetical protein
MADIVGLVGDTAPAIFPIMAVSVAVGARVVLPVYWGAPLLVRLLKFVITPGARAPDRGFMFRGLDWDAAKFADCALFVNCEFAVLCELDEELCCEDDVLPPKMS